MPTSFFWLSTDGSHLVACGCTLDSVQCSFTSQSLPVSVSLTASSTLRLGPRLARALACPLSLPHLTEFHEKVLPFDLSSNRHSETIHPHALFFQAGPPTWISIVLLASLENHKTQKRLLPSTKEVHVSNSTPGCLKTVSFDSFFSPPSRGTCPYSGVELHRYRMCFSSSFCDFLAFLFEGLAPSLVSPSANRRRIDVFCLFLRHKSKPAQDPATPLHPYLFAFVFMEEAHLPNIRMC